MSPEALTSKVPTMRRQIAVATGLVAACTALAVGFGVTALEPKKAGTAAAARRMAPVLVAGLAATWDEPTGRARLVEALASQTGQPVELVDSAREVLIAARGACPRWSEAEVRREQVVLGHLRVCAVDPYRHRRWAARALVLALVGALAALAAYVVARRLSAPLDALARRADALGRGLSTGPTLEGPREIALVSRALEEMARALAGRIERQRTLLALAGHELRTPVARLRVLADLAQDHVDLERTHSDLVREVDAIGLLVEDILLAARADLGQLDVRPAQVAELLERSRGTSSVDLAVDPALAIAAEPALIARAFAIVIDNAFRHGQPPVRASASLVGAHIELAIDDHGPGVPPERRAHIFSPHPHPPSRATRSSTGLGLGLGLARTLVTAHGGTLDVSEAPGGGARFVFRFPALGRG